MARGSSPQCKAKAKSTGERCQNPVVPGYKVCRFHGANPKNKGGNPRIDELNARRAPIMREKMKGNILGVIHGAFGKSMYTDEERALYETLIDEFQEAYGLEDPAAQVLLDELCFRLVKVKCAERGGSERALSDHSGRISNLMAQLHIRPDKAAEGVAKGNVLAEAIREIATAASTRMVEDKQWRGKALPAASEPDVIEVEVVEDKQDG